MNRLDNDHLYLLIDEPIYVLEEHFDHQTEDTDLDEKVDVVKPAEYQGDNKKGILIIVEGEDSLKSEEDQVFLFKGLNALNITLDDVALIEGTKVENHQTIQHNIKLRFFAEAGSEVTYRPEVTDNLKVLECHIIAVIRSDENLKRLFWEGLKELFKD